MKNKKRCISFVAILLLLQVFSSKIIAQGLSLNIDIDKQEFIEGEPIYVIYTLTNSSTEIRNSARFYLEGQLLQLTVAGADGKTLPYCGHIFSYSSGESPFAPIKPNSSIQYVSELMQDYHNYREKDAPFPLPIVVRLGVGSYHIAAKYTINDSTIVSNTLTFSIVPPRDEDAALFEILKTKFRIDYILGNNLEEKITTFKDLSTKYKKSKYYPLVCQYWAAFLSKQGDTVQAREVGKSIIKTFPNSGHAMQIFKWLKLSDKENREFLQELKALYPNSRAAKYQENALSN